MVAMVAYAIYIQLWCDDVVECDRSDQRYYENNEVK